MNLVLVHGGGVDASCWQPLLAHLDSPTWAVDLPGRNARPGDLAALMASDFIDSIVEDIVSHELREIVLVGHSLAGILLPGVAAKIPERLGRLVFLAAAIPPEGKSVIDVLATLSVATAELASHVGDEILAANGALHPDLATKMFCNDMTEEQTAFTLSCLVPEAFGVVVEPVALDGLRGGVPCTYVRFLQDASLDVASQNAMAANLGDPEVIDLDAGHMAMISRPAELAAVLDRLARNPGSNQLR